MRCKMSIRCNGKRVAGKKEGRNPRWRFLYEEQRKMKERGEERNEATGKQLALSFWNLSIELVEET